MIKEWDITALRPSLLPNVEYSPWEIHEHGSNISISMSRSISNMHYMCEIFQIVSSPLDQMLVRKRKRRPGFLLMGSKLIACLVMLPIAVSASFRRKA